MDGRFFLLPQLLWGMGIVRRYQAAGEGHVDCGARFVQCLAKNFPMSRFKVSHGDVVDGESGENTGVHNLPFQGSKMGVDLTLIRRFIRGKRCGDFQHHIMSLSNFCGATDQN